MKEERNVSTETLGTPATNVKNWVQGVGLSRHRTHTHLELLVRDLDTHLACHDLILMRKEPAGREGRKQ